MRKQAIVVGLGQFGMSLTRALTQRGVEVLAVDVSPRRVQEAASFSTRAVVFDATDEQALADTEPARRDLAVCAIGDEAKEGSIITTALLRQLGAPRVIARATDPLHERILRLVGAHEVVNPERAFGERLAARLAMPGVIDEVGLGDDLVIAELHTPPGITGRTLMELGLPARFGLNVVALRRKDAEGVANLALPRPDDPLRADDVLIVVARPGVVAEVMGRL